MRRILMLTSLAAALLAGAMGCTGKSNKTNHKQQPTPQAPGAANPDNYKTIDDLLDAANKGEVITDEIAKNFADKQPDNSITNEQLRNLASSREVSKVSDKVIEALAKKTEFNVQILKDNYQDFAEGKFPQSALQVLINKIPDKSLDYKDFTKLSEILRRKIYDENSRLDLLKKVKQVDPKQFLNELNGLKQVDSDTSKPKSHKMENAEMQILINKLKFPSSDAYAEPIKKNINDALEKLGYTAEVKLSS
jgi:hypothetical protein